MQSTTVYQRENDVQVSSVIPLDKHTDNKYSISNCYLISVLNASQKWFWKICFPENKKPCLPFVAAYMENYCTHHVLIWLLEKWRLHLDKCCFIGAVRA